MIQWAAIGEGLAAGCWTVGLSRYSNYMDIDSLEHEKELTESDLEYKHNISKDILCDVVVRIMSWTILHTYRVLLRTLIRDLRGANSLNSQLKHLLLLLCH